MTFNYVKFFKALGDETRLKIVRYLLKNDFCACTFASMTKKDQTSTEENHKKAECQEATQKKEYVYM